jgi:hypothetical protein
MMQGGKHPHPKLCPAATMTGSTFSSLSSGTCASPSSVAACWLYNWPTQHPW